MSIAFVFPGQGSQELKQLSDFAEVKQVQDSFKEANDALGQDLWQLSQEGPEEALNTTTNTQPLLLAAGVALWRLWQEKGGTKPAFMAGHSLGEYTALVCADSLSFADGLKLVQNRGKYMQMAVERQGGAMAAILGLDKDKVREICDSASDVSYVYPANINTPTQIVISGYEAGVQEAGTRAKEAGAKRVVPLAVSVPSHCNLMNSAADLLAKDFETIDFKMPSIPVVQNVDGQPAQNIEELKDKLIRQLTESVQWVACVEHLHAQGVKATVECGPKKVLSSLNRSIASELETAAIGLSLDSFNAALKEYSN